MNYLRTSLQDKIIIQKFDWFFAFSRRVGPAGTDRPMPNMPRALAMVHDVGADAEVLEAEPAPRSVRGPVCTSRPSTDGALVACPAEPR